MSAGSYVNEKGESDSGHPQPILSQCPYSSQPLRVNQYEQTPTRIPTPRLWAQHSSLSALSSSAMKETQHQRLLASNKQTSSSLAIQLQGFRFPVLIFHI